MPFWSKEAKSKEAAEPPSPPSAPVPISYTLSFRNFLSRNAPIDFDVKLENMRPYLFTSFVAWPLYWLYRGLEYNKSHADLAITAYINQTYFHARAIQIGIVLTGLLFSTYEFRNVGFSIKDMENSKNTTSKAPKNQIRSNPNNSKINIMNYYINKIASYFHGPEEERISPNLGEDLRQLVQSNDFEERLDAAMPFLITSLISWPAFWVYRGLDWTKNRHHTSLSNYIRRTFFQAKMIQFSIIAMGIVATLNADNRDEYKTHDV